MSSQGGATEIGAMWSVELSESLREAVLTSLAHEPRFGAINDTHSPGPQDMLSCEVDPELRAWYVDTCGTYRLPFADFVVGSFVELRFLGESRASGRIELFRDSFAAVSEPRGKLDLTVPSHISEWLRGSATQLGLEEAGLVDICLRSRKAFCQERVEKTGVHSLPPELAERRANTAPITDFVASGQFGRSSRVRRTRSR